jgi:ferrochelatase
MAHGGPDSLDDIEPFLGHIVKHRTGRPASPELVAIVKDRYAQIGGRSPLLTVTHAQAEALQQALNRETDRFRVYVGMRHWTPFIRETLRQIIDDKPDHLVAISMAPQYSRMSVGAYIQAARDALSDLKNGFSVSFVEHWHRQPLLLDGFSKKVREAMNAYPEPIRESIFLLFTAHSLPESILKDNDPYPVHLRETMEGVVKRLGTLMGADRYGFAYQSQGMTGATWLGPDVMDVVAKIASEGGPATASKRPLLIAPIGFVADHVEILYDIDIDYKKRAEAQGVMVQRIESLNATPLLIQALAATVYANLPV